MRMSLLPAPTLMASSPVVVALVAAVTILAVVGIWLVLVREKHPLAATALQGVPERIPTAPVGLSSY
jgi:hypothetical protein